MNKICNVESCKEVAIYYTDIPSKGIPVKLCQKHFDWIEDLYKVRLMPNKLEELEK